MFAHCFNDFVRFIAVYQPLLRRPLLALILAGGINKDWR